MYKETYPEFHKKVFRNISKKIKESGLSQRDQLLAGLDLRHLRRIKSGEVNITLKTIWNICHRFGFNPAEIFK